MVDIPLTLDMTKYAPLSTHPSKERANNYKLYAIVNHFGGINSGHYFCEAYNFSTGKWYNIDDEDVQEVAEPELQSNMAYLLFYIM